MTALDLTFTLNALAGVTFAGVFFVEELGFSSSSSEESSEEETEAFIFETPFVIDCGLETTGVFLTGITSSSESSDDDSSTFFTNGCFVAAIFCTGVAIVLPGVTNFFAGGSSSDEDSSEDSFFETTGDFVLEILA